MRVTITIEKKHAPHNKGILFGAKYHYISANFGNPTGLSITSVTCCDEYKKECGDVNFQWSSYSSFLMDCVKYNFQITKINGTEVNLDPYKDIYYLPEGNEDGTYEIEIIKK